MADAFSLIQFKDLPTFTGTLSENATLVAVLDNTRTVRIDWDILNSGLIRGSADQPSDTDAPGEQGNLYVGSTGLYSYADGYWGKSPRYTENWDDLVSGVRFLRVDGSQSLSSEEKSQVLANVGLTIASAGSAGLVKAWDNTSALTDVAPVIINTDGTQYVAKATENSLGVVNLTDVATHDYVDDAIDTAIAAIEDLPIATAEVVGGVLSDAPLADGGDGVFTVDATDGKVTIRPASLYIYDEDEEVNKGGLPGIYSVTAVDDTQALDYAPTLGLVKELIGSAGGLNDVPVATTASVGGVKAWSDNSSYSSTDAAKVIINASGLQFVPKAESNVTGTVRVVTTEDAVTDVVDAASSFTVPTVGAVYSFVSTNFLKLIGGKVSVSALPLATGSTVGVIKGSSTVNIDNNGTASVPDAAVDSKGVVMLAEVDNSGELVADSGVTTAYQVKNYVTSKLTTSALSGLYVSKEDYNDYVAATNDSIAQVSLDQGTLAADVEALTNDVSALQQARIGAEALLNVDSPTITTVTGWVRYTGAANSTVVFGGVSPTGYVSTLTFQTEVPVTFGGTILWDKGETPSMLSGKGYVFQITSFPGSNVKLGRKVMEYTPQSTT